MRHPCIGEEFAGGITYTFPSVRFRVGTTAVIELATARCRNAYHESAADELSMESHTWPPDSLAATISE